MGSNMERLQAIVTTLHKPDNVEQGIFDVGVFFGPKEFHIVSILEGSQPIVVATTLRELADAVEKVGK